MVILLATRPIHAHQSISGVVLNSRSLHGIAGVQVIVVGSSLRAVANADGRFRIEGAGGGEITVRATAIGYQPATQVTRAGASDLRFVLNEMAVKLDEVVVTGTIGAVEKRSVANAIAKISATDVVAVAPVTDVSQLINGRAAGALVRQGSGTIGGGSRITLRGSATLGLNDQPLVYVDGVRVDNKVGVGLGNEGAGGPNGAISRPNDYNPEDIESVEIIKGPAAATLYGTEAANGVIQIITKKGRRGDNVSWNGSIRQGATWFQDPGGRVGNVYGVVNNQVTGVDVYKLHIDQGETHFRTGHLQGYALNAAGGTAQVSYYLGAVFDRDNGTDVTQSLTNYGGRLNVGITPSERLQVNTSLTYIDGHTLTPNDGNFGGPIFAFVTVRPALLTASQHGWLFGSPQQWDREWKHTDDVHRFTGSVQVTHRLTSWLSQRLTGGVDLLSDDFNAISEKMPPDLELAFGSGIARGGRTVEARDATNTTVDYGASATTKLGKRIGSTTSVGFQYYHKQQELVSSSGSTFPAAGITTISAAAVRSSGETFLENNTLGLYLQEQVVTQRSIVSDWRSTRRRQQRVRRELRRREVSQGEWRVGHQ